VTAVDAPNTAPRTALNVRVLADLIDGRYADVRRELRTVLCDPQFAPVIAPATPDYRKQVMQWAKALADRGLTAPGFPARYGGRDDPGANVASFETIALSDLSLLVKFGVQFGLWGGAVHQLGTKRHHERYLQATARLKLAGCFAMTEAGHGSDVQSLATTATFDPNSDSFIIQTPTDQDHKDYIGNAACDGRVAAVFAQLIVGGEGHGVHAFVVELRDEDGTVRPGVRIEDCGEKAGLNGVDNGRIWFSDVRIPRENLLNRYGDVDDQGRYTSPIENPTRRFFTMVGALVQGRVCISGASVSAAKTAVTIAVRYGLRRTQFGPEPGHEVPLLDYRTHQRRLMPLLARTYALHFAQAELLDRFDAVTREDTDTDRDRRQLESLAAGMKATTSWHAMQTIQTARECCGGAGYLSINRFAALRADTDIFTTFEGDNTVLMMLLARGLLTDYAEHFGELNPVGTVTFVAGQAVETVIERLFARQIVQTIGDVVLRDGDEEDLLSADDQLELLRWREGHITAAVAQRLKRGLSDGHDPFDVFRAVQDHAVAAAQAHMATVVLEAFGRAVKSCDDENVRAALRLLCDLYALHEVESDRAFFMEHGRLSGPRCKALTREVNRLCNDVRLIAGELVDGFAIPDALLGAPIGLAEAAPGAAPGAAAAPA
jgi:acyl-CoA oxidase